MKLLKRILLVSLIIINMFLNTSCWNYKDVERLNVVMSFAIDKDFASDQYILTVEVARPEPGQQQTKYMSDIYESKGSTIFEAVRNLITKAGKRTYWAHAIIGIFSKDVATKDMTPVIDFLYRDAEVRGELFVFISNKDTAREILETAHNPNELRTTKLQYFMENQKSIGKYPKSRLFNIVENFASEDTATLLPLIDLKLEEDRMLPVAGGSAIFKHDKVVGYLNEKETQYALWIMGELKGGVLVVDNIAETKNNITFEISRNKTKIKPIYKGDELRIEADFDTSVYIAEISGNLKFQNEVEKEKIRKAAKEVLEARLRYLIKKMQSEYKSDIFSFGKKVNIKKPKLWKNLKANWSEEFTSLPVDINVDLLIKGSNMTKQPLKGESSK